jgi:hypothetical protein
MEPEGSRAEIFQELSAITKKQPASYQGQIAAGVLAGLNDKLEEGLDRLDKAAELKPQEPWAYFWWGLFAARLDLEQPALEALTVSLQLGLPTGLMETLETLAGKTKFFAKHGRGLLASGRPELPQPQETGETEEAELQTFHDFLQGINRPFHQEGQTENLASIPVPQEPEKPLTPSNGNLAVRETGRTDILGQVLQNYPERLKKVTRHLMLSEASEQE